MTTFHYEKQVLGHRISADIRQIGEDWLAEISGGCRPHIGSVSVETFAGGRSRWKEFFFQGIGTM